MKKKIVEIENPIKTLIASSPGFKKKELSDFHLELGGVCEFGCLYCSTDTGQGTSYKMQTYKDAARSQYPAEFSKDRLDQHTFCKTFAISYKDMIERLEEELKKYDRTKSSGKTLMFAMLVDNFAPTLMRDSVTLAALELLLEYTDFRIRCLSKSNAVAHNDLIRMFLKNPDRFVVGLSIGTLDDDLGRRIEQGTSRPTARLKALHKLQDAGVATFGMLCPVFKPTMHEDELESLIDAINPRACEHVWAEPYNDRKNWRHVQEALGKAHDDYEWFSRAYGTRKERDPDTWSHYATELYVRIRNKAEKEGWIEKLRFLLYEEEIRESDGSKFEGHVGSDVLLQSEKDKSTGRSKNPVFAGMGPVKLTKSKKPPADIAKIHRAVQSATEDLSKAWVELAKQLIELRSAMKDKSSDIWQSYFSVANFSEYCDKVAQHGRAACYQLMQSYEFLQREAPEVLDGPAESIPSYTKCRLLVTKSDFTAKQMEELLSMVLEPARTRVEIRERIQEYTPQDPDIKTKKTLGRIHTQLVNVLENNGVEDSQMRLLPYWTDILKLIEE